MIRKFFSIRLVVLAGFVLITLIECKDAVRIVRHQGPSRAQYENWVRPYASRPLTLNFRGEVVRLRLIITAVEGDEEISSQRKPSILTALNDRTVAYGCQIFADGRVHYFYSNSMGVKGGGGGYPTIPEVELERLDKLLANLPDDGARLPPAGRRLVVQTPDGNRWRAQVYDRADAPAEILEIIRLSRSGIRSWLPQFQPASEMAAHESYGDVALCMSPDGKQIISSSRQGPLRFWDPDTREVVKEISIPQYISVEGLSFSPDGAVAAIQGRYYVRLLDTKTWRRFRDFTEPMIGQKPVSHLRFTQDGRFLLLQSSEPTLLIYDTKTWRRLKTPPDDMPRDAIAYITAPTTKRAVYLSKSGVLALWDADKRREFAKLDDNVSLNRAAFSPDESMVAVATAQKVSGGYWRPYRIRIWRVGDGMLAHELRPFERDIDEAVEGLLWRPDGAYLLAATKADTSRGVDVWNVKSGRHRGEFIGCPTTLTALELLDGGRRLVVGCADGRIRIWDAESAIKQIAEFERSLVRAK